MSPNGSMWRFEMAAPKGCTFVKCESCGKKHCLMPGSRKKCACGKVVTAKKK